jgi:2,4-dienoyl-CoA reductase-like NADH-dependent reductase (Old Yellow Enzyme family)/thioredoxin reductase
MSARFPNLFQPLTIRGCTIKNRILSTGHDTTLPDAAMINEPLIAYQEARARGGTGLIVVQVSGVHETARYTNHILMITDDSAIEGYRKLAERVHVHGTKIFGQLFHPGREILETQGGLLPVAYAPSAMPNERYHVMPRAMSRAMIAEIVAGYGDAARRMHQAGLDGAEIVASHGYLPSQFLNPRVNRREDEYGGDLPQRLRFLEEVIADIRAKTGDAFVLGLRISGGEMDLDGLAENEALEAISALASRIDYVSVVAGSSATIGGAVHIVPPMSFANGYLAPFTAEVKRRVQIPVFLAGRINQPQEAEAIIAAGQADVCGMTRALICDPFMPQKAETGHAEDIRACIACNQACIGHFHKGQPISCIQNPLTGRELAYASHPAPARRKKVMVVGGGPAGMKAAVTAAERGHEVTVYEAANQLGGQALLAQLLPGRAEFGGLVTNLKHELGRLGVAVQTNTRVDRAMIAGTAPDAVIVATGAEPFRPHYAADGNLQTVDAWDVLTGRAEVGRSVVVIDWRCDWIGIGLAVKCARAGSRVRLAANGTMPGESIPLYVRDQSNAELQDLGVEILPFMRLYGSDDNTVYLQHTVSGKPLVLEDVDTLLLCTGHRPRHELVDSLSDYAGEVHFIGDCLAPRTAEEAVFEGFKSGYAL